MYQKETKHGHRFEYFQDAIVDGRLINSTSKDSSKITHPHFFKNLMKSCNPFDFFFDVRAINLNEKYTNNDFQFDFEEAADDYNHVIIIDKRQVP